MEFRNMVTITLYARQQKRHRCIVLSFKSAISLSSFTFIKRLLSSSPLSAIRVVSSVYVRLLIFLPAILIPAANASVTVTAAATAGCVMEGSAFVCIGTGGPPKVLGCSIL